MLGRFGLGVLPFNINGSAHTAASAPIPNVGVTAGNNNNMDYSQQAYRELEPVAESCTRRDASHLKAMSLNLMLRGVEVHPVVGVIRKKVESEVLSEIKEDPQSPKPT